jgi:ribonuclease P protein component
MLDKSHRLNLKENFRWVASGKSKTTPRFKIFYRYGDNTEPKVGVSITSSQFKKAVLRNQAKRLMFEAARESLALLPKNINLVIMPRAQILETEFEVLLGDFKNAVSDLQTN